MPEEKPSVILHIAELSEPLQFSFRSSGIASINQGINYLKAGLDVVRLALQNL